MHVEFLSFDFIIIYFLLIRLTFAVFVEIVVYFYFCLVLRIRIPLSPSPFLPHARINCAFDFTF
jgi:hypothetical protein